MKKKLLLMLFPLITVTTVAQDLHISGTVKDARGKLLQELP